MENLTMNTLTHRLERSTHWARGLATLGLVAGAWALTVAASSAHARSDVYWSVGVNGPGVAIGATNGPVVVSPPGYYYDPRPVVVAPPPVYLPRPPVVYAPPVVYGPSVVYAPRPVVIGGRGPVYWDDDRGRDHWRGHRHGHRHDRDWEDEDRGGRGRH
jgi:hypothetical protein